MRPGVMGVRILLILLFQGLLRPALSDVSLDDLTEFYRGETPPVDLENNTLAEGQHGNN